ncbi:MAG: hypothetical protein KF752_13110 [Pirellulaceae bacterium]|nr:hypothetical protein [Pirellulaceae bacterium]
MLWAIAGPQDDRVLQAICQHGLPDIAVGYARARRDVPGGAVARQSDAVAWWTMREMEFLAQAALHGVMAGSNGWQECGAAAERYRQRPDVDSDLTKNRRGPWIEWQLARCDLVHAQSVLATFLANPMQLQARDQALELVRGLIERSERLLTEIRRRQPIAARQSPQDGAEAAAEQLRNLLADTELLQCEALLVRSQLYPPNAADRAAALSEMLEKVQALQSRGGGRLPSSDALLVAQATAQVELGDPQALQRLVDLSQRADRPALRLQAGVLGVRYFTQRKDFRQAEELLNRLQWLLRDDASLEPLWQLSQIELTLGRMAEMQPEQQAAVAGQLTQQAEQLGQRFGGYWRTRAEALLVSHLASQRSEDAQLGTVLLMAEIRQLIAAGREQQAIEKLLQAYTAQLSAGNAADALQWLSMAAAMLRRSQQWQRAAEVIEQSAGDWSQAPEAAETHLWAIRARAEVLREPSAHPTAGQAFKASIQQQLRLWPDEQATSQARLWLKNWMMARGQASEYLEFMQAELPRVHQPSVADAMLNEWIEVTLNRGASLTTDSALDWIETPAVPFAEPQVAYAARLVALAALELSECAFGGSWSEPEDIRRRWQEMTGWLSDSTASQWSVTGFVAIAVALDELRLQREVVPTLSPDSRQGRYQELPLQPESKPNGQDNPFNQLTPLGRAGVAPALVAVLDWCAPDQRRAAWLQLTLEPHWSRPSSEGLKPQKLNPLAHMALLRVAAWQQTEGADVSLQEFAEQHAKHGFVQLMYAYRLAELEQLAPAIERTRRIAAFAPAGSSLQSAARLCLVRLLVRSGAIDEAKNSARLFLATAPQINALWAQRLNRLAGEASE